jgi:3-oxoadipate enol-lactonase
LCPRVDGYGPAAHGSRVSNTSDPRTTLERGTGPTVVFLHGYPLHRAMWMPQLTGLSDRYRIVLLDLPGYGTAVDAAVPDTLSGFAEVVRGTVEGQRGGKATIVGHSFGGYVALQLFRDHPDLFERLILVSTRSGADSPEAREKRYAMVRKLEDPKEGLDVDDVAKTLLSEATWSARGPVIEVVRAIVAAAPNPLVRTLRAIADRPDLTPVLKGIHVPSLVVWGSGDRLIPPAQTQALVSGIEGAEGVAIPDAGHLSPLEAPDRFDDAVRAFLGRSDRPRGP